MTIDHVIVDDHALVVEGMQTLLRRESSIAVVGTAANGELGVKLVRELLPDVVLMDVSMPVMGGIEATKLIKAECPQVMVVGISMHDDAATEQRMRDAGAIEYVNKGIAAANLVEIVRNTFANVE